MKRQTKTGKTPTLPPIPKSEPSMARRLQTERKPRADRLTATLNRIMKDYKEHTVFTLDEFVERSRRPIEECIEFLSKQTSRGELIQGRRGHPTRFVFGDAEDSEWSKRIRSEEYRRQWRKDNNRDPHTGRPLERARYERKAAPKPAAGKAEGKTVTLRLPPGVEIVEQ